MKKIKPYGNKIEGWMTDNELRWLYKAAKTMASVVEIGSWKGRSTHALLSGCKGMVTAIDHFNGTPGAKFQCEHAYESFIKNVGYFRNLKILKMDSQEAASKVEKVEMVFIDGDHSYEAVKKDIETWLPKTTKLICGHDFRSPGVTQAVLEEIGTFSVFQKTIWYKILK